MSTTHTRARRNGEGSRPRPVKDRPGLWRFRYWDLAGERRQVYVRGTEQDAWDKLRELTAERDKGIPFAASRYTLAAWLPAWIEGIPPHRIRSQTRTRYRECAARWQADPIAARRLHLITREHIGGALARMERAGLAPSTQRLTLSILRMALGAALDAGHIGRNVARQMRAPRVTPRAVEPPRGAELDALRAAIAVDPNEAIWACGLLAGLREGETLGLRWRDVDLASGLLHIRGTLIYGSNTVGEPKSAAGRRDLPADPALIAALTRHRDRLYGPGVRPHPAGFVFATPASGHALHGGSVLRWWHALCDRAGVPRCRYHDLRHAFATAAIEAGTPIAVLSRYLGHASIQVTVDTYGHHEMVGLPWQRSAANL